VSTDPTDDLRTCIEAPYLHEPSPAFAPHPTTSTPLQSLCRAGAPVGCVLESLTMEGAVEATYSKGKKKCHLAYEVLISLAYTDPKPRRPEYRTCSWRHAL
jgi:hypothetical protein